LVGAKRIIKTQIKLGKEHAVPDLETRVLLARGFLANSNKREMGGPGWEPKDLINWVPDLGSKVYKYMAVHFFSPSFFFTLSFYQSYNHFKTINKTLDVQLYHKQKIIL
jgi:hypothetical protein